MQKYLFLLCSLIVLNGYFSPNIMACSEFDGSQFICGGDEPDFLKIVSVRDNKFWLKITNSETAILPLDGRIAAARSEPDLSISGTCDKNKITIVQKKGNLTGRTIYTVTSTQVVISGTELEFECPAEGCDGNNYLRKGVKNILIFCKRQ